MKYTIATIAAVVGLVAAGDVVQNEKRANGLDDPTILQYALTLEHLEAFFYKQALGKFDAKAFKKAGYPAYVRQRIAEIAGQEATHVAFLQGALSAVGQTPTKACKYNFPYKTVDEFLAISRILEGVGVSAYLGAAADIDVKAYLTAAGSILTVEARHQAVVSEFQGESGFPSPFDTPLDPSQVYTLASPFIVSCPKTNPTLPVTAFPALTVKGNPKGGKKVQLTFECHEGNKVLYAHFLNGLSDISVKIDPDHKVTFPKGLTGTVYVVVSTSEELTDANTVAGPSIIQLPDPDVHDSWGSKKHH